MERLQREHHVECRHCGSDEIREGSRTKSKNDVSQFFQMKKVVGDCSLLSTLYLKNIY